MFRNHRYQEALDCYLQGPQTDTTFSLHIGLSYWMLNQLSQAAPFLRRAQVAFPVRKDVQNALQEISVAEIWDLQKRLTWTRSTAEKRRLSLLLGRRYEETYQYTKAAREFESALTPKSDYYSILHVAYLYKLAQDYMTAAGYYLKASEISTAPHFAMMWALDCLVLAGDEKKAQQLIAHMSDHHPNREIDWFRARLYKADKEKELANQTLQSLAGYYEKEAWSGRNRSGNLLSAAKANLDSNSPEIGLTILENLRRSGSAHELDIDYLKAEYFFNNKQYDQAIAIYSRHPENLSMQISYGWALFYSGKVKEARQQFQKLKEEYFHLPSVLDGWHTVNNLRPWNFFYIFSRQDFGDYQKERDIHTSIAKYQWGRYAWALSHSSTSTYAGPLDYDFQEDLFGGRVFRRLDDTSGLQFHGLFFQNTDSTTDGGWVFGGKYYHFGNDKLHWDTELNASQYPNVGSIQSSLGMTLLLDSHWSTSFKVEGSYLRGDEATWAETKTPIGLRLALHFQDRNAVVTLEGHTGEEILMVDSEGLYAYNGLDTYKDGGSFMILQKGPGLEFYAKLSGTRVTSQYLRTANERLHSNSGEEFFAKTASLGFNMRFF